MYTAYNVGQLCGQNYYTPAPRRGRGVYCFTPVRLSFSSFCPSKIFFVTFFSVTVDGRNLIFGHKRHIGIPYCGQRFWTRQIPTSVCRLSWFLYTLNIYPHFSSHFSQQLLMAEIWYLVTSFIQVPHIVGSVFDPSDSYFLFAEERGYHK